MSIVVATAMKPRLLSLALDYLENLQLRLFVADYVPTGDMTSANFIEPLDSGYDPKTGHTFGSPVLNASNEAQTTGVAQTWTFTLDQGAFTIYGYYFTDPDDGDNVVFAERAASPTPITSAGQMYSVTPRVRLQTL